MTDEEINKLLKRYRRAHNAFTKAKTRPNNAEYAAISQRVIMSLPLVVETALKWRGK